MRSVKLAHVGVGYWGRNLLRNFASTSNCDVVAVCDVEESVRSNLARQYPSVDILDNYDRLLERSDIEAVSIATQTPHHYEMAKKALERDKHVFVEKPMARTREEARHLVELAEAKALTLMTGHLLLYHPAFVYVDELIRSGALGEVFYLYSTRVNLGIIRADENALESLIPHDFSVALRFLDSRPVSISVQGQSFLRPGIEDVVFATVRFENGQIAHLHASWLDPHKARKVTIVGSEKMAVIDDVESVEKVRLYDKGVRMAPGEGRSYANYVEAMTIRNGDITIPRIDMVEPLAEECRHFVDSILNATAPNSDGYNGLAVVTLLEAGMRSLRNGGRPETL